MNENYFDINVSKNGQHFFATSPRSCTTNADVVKVYPELKKKFPKEEGYEISITQWKCYGEHINPEKLIEEYQKNDLLHAYNSFEYGANPAPKDVPFSILGTFPVDGILEIISKKINFDGKEIFVQMFYDYKNQRYDFSVNSESIFQEPAPTGEAIDDFYQRSVEDLLERCLTIYNELEKGVN